MMRLRWLAVLCVLAIAAPRAQQPSVDDFFRTISDGWVRLNPNLAVSTRYFAGEEQDRLEQQISSYSDAAERERLAYIQQGLRDLARFDRSRMTDAQRLSADVLRYHLQSYIDWAKYDDYLFPLDQFNGANIWLPNALTIQHPIRTAKDASNYVARLGHAGPRMAEAVAESRQRAERDLIPPRFILDLTIAQMRRFVHTPPAQNPFVTSLDERAAAIQGIAPDARAALVAQAERIVRESRSEEHTSELQSQSN